MNWTTFFTIIAQFCIVYILLSLGSVSLIATIKTIKQGLVELHNIQDIKKKDDVA